MDYIIKASDQCELNRGTKRYIITNKEGKVINDAAGWGYKTKETANAFLQNLIKHQKSKKTTTIKRKPKYKKHLYYWLVENFWFFGEIEDELYDYDDWDGEELPYDLVKNILKEHYEETDDPSLLRRSYLLIMMQDGHISMVLTREK